MCVCICFILTFQFFITRGWDQNLSFFITIYSKFTIVQHHHFIGKNAPVEYWIVSNETNTDVHMSWYLRATHPPLPPFFSKLQHVVAIVAA